MFFVMRTNVCLYVQCLGALCAAAKDREDQPGHVPLLREGSVVMPPL